MVKNNIVLITSGQPSLNPRLVKEADSLCAAGYQVKVLYQYWNSWGTAMDELLLPAKKWQSVRVGGDPKQECLTYFFSRMIHKVALFGYTCGISFFAKYALARSSFFLIRATKKHKADLYIAHNLAALPAAVFAAEKYKSKCGFDAEDFHRQETTDDLKSVDLQLKSSIENIFILKLNYMSVASLLTGEAYNQLYKNRPACILNVFPKTQKFTKINVNQTLKLVWFSQYIGFGRGLETVFNALSQLTKLDFELHLIGFLSAEMEKFMQSSSFPTAIISKITIHAPLPPDQLLSFISRFDIGLATEISQPLNRDICLSNKIFSYIQAGLAVLASDTTAQKQLVSTWPQIGKLYDKNSIENLTACIKDFYADRELLSSCKKDAFELGQTTLNWETESIKFLSLIENTLAV